MGIAAQSAREEADRRVASWMTFDQSVPQPSTRIVHAAPPPEATRISTSVPRHPSRTCMGTSPSADLAQPASSIEDSLAEQKRNGESITVHCTRYKDEEGWW